LFIFGTRPEAVKIAPVVRSLAAEPERFHVECCSTGQHRELLRPVLEVFSIGLDYDLDVMLPGQTLYQSTARILTGLENVIARARPDLIVVQGDTTTTLCGALAGFYAGVTVAHIEAGMRTYDIRQPFPEEMNRVLTSKLSTLHFAATQGAAQALAAEGIREHVEITGNTSIDALLYVAGQLDRGELNSDLRLPLDSVRKLIVVTVHRRESFDVGIAQICRGITAIARRPDVQIVIPVHPNPAVHDKVHSALSGYGNVFLTEPLGYIEFIDLLRSAYLILTDSGGVQEEAPSLGKPVVVIREKTERPEAVAAGSARLVGVDPVAIVRETNALLDDGGEYRKRSFVHNPYGDGRASARIAAGIRNYFAG
jgi:UDP-N-acetylglucosamine 2-epimerase (non-hydrolysing)